MDRLPLWLRQHLAAARMLLVLTVVCGIAYPAVVTAIAQVPGLEDEADGSLIRVDGRLVGSRLLGQLFVDGAGRPLPQYVQSRPSAAGNGDDPTASGGSNLGPEDVLDSLPDSRKRGDSGRSSLLTQVCRRSRAVGQLEGVDGMRPYCTPDGVGAVLVVIRQHGPGTPVTDVVSANQACPAKPFVDSYDGVAVRCATVGEDLGVGTVVPVRGPGRAWPGNPVPPDAVTASASGLDPDISPEYARLQAPRVARARHLDLDTVLRLIRAHTDGRTLGFMGAPGVNVLELNLALDRLGR